MSGIPKLQNHPDDLSPFSPGKAGFWVVLTFLMVFVGWSVVGQNVSITSIQSPGPTAANPISIDIKFIDGVDILNLSDFIVNNGVLQDLVREVPDSENFENGDLTYFRVNPSSFELITNISRINEYFKEKLAKSVIAIDVDSNNNIYYLTFADGVYKYNPTGPDQLIINKNQFKTPLDLVISSSNQIIVADKDAYKVRVFKSDGSFSYDIGGFMGKDGNEFYGPTGLAIDENDILYVADAYTGNTSNIPDQVKIYKILEFGPNFLDRYNSSNGVVIQDPYRIAVDKIGNVFLSDSGGNSGLGRVLIFNNQKELIKTIEGGLQGAPGDLIIDDYGYLYVIDFGEELTFNDIFQNPIVLANNFNTIKNKNYFINVYDKDYNYLTRFNQSLNLPIDLALDNCGYLYVNDLDLNGEMNLSTLKVDATFDFKLRKFKRKDNFSANIIPNDQGLVEVRIENKILFKCGTQPNGEFSILYQPIVVVNNPPFAINDSYSTLQNTTLNIPSSGVLTNDTDADSDSLTATVVNSTTNGVLTLASNGSFSYVPNLGYSGPDSFTYFANDGEDDSNTATVTITVTEVSPTNTAPIATNDNFS
ncbi:MAG: Ig-like domain-containing protein, partial [Gillisia sp.]|nr:Ig-like domain-containing protein [Gillisia sp.]